MSYSTFIYHSAAIINIYLKKIIVTVSKKSEETIGKESQVN